MRWRWLTLGLAAAWSLVTAMVVLNYHVGAGSVAPDITLYQENSSILKTYGVILTALLLIATLDLTHRTWQRSARSGVPTQVLGACLAVFSLFGLLYGLASLGVIGGLLALSAQPFHQRVIIAPGQPAPPSTRDAWSLGGDSNS